MSGSGSLVAGFPTSPLTDPATGTITPVWRSFLLALFTRTGGAPGAVMPAAEAALAGERTARVAADSAQALALVEEAAARAGGDQAVLQQALAEIAAEASARRAALAAERAARIAANSSLVGTFTFEQVTPSDIWGIRHNLHWHPTVTVVDSANQLVEGGVVYDSADQCTLTFASPFAGVAYLS